MPTEPDPSTRSPAAPWLAGEPSVGQAHHAEPKGHAVTEAVLVSLTAKGIETMTDLSAEYQDGYSWLFEGVSAEDLAAFVPVACTVMDRIRTIDC